MIFKTNDNTAQSTYAAAGKFDSNVGYSEDADGSGSQSWMWKRHAGFDVVTYKGNGVFGHDIAHSLGKIPEMIWIKNRDNANSWATGHKGLNDGTDAWDWYVGINETSQQTNDDTLFKDTYPTSTHFTVGNSNQVNNSSHNYIAMLFASVDGISKVGYYNGSGSSRTISLGFAPRLLILKKVTSSDSWYVLDTIRGWGSGNDNYIELNKSDAQGGHDFGAPTSDGFSLPNGNVHHNQSGQTYIYYAHA